MCSCLKQTYKETDLLLYKPISSLRTILTISIWQCFEHEMVAETSKIDDFCSQIDVTVSINCSNQSGNCQNLNQFK